jgi:hypothetical protein
VRFSTPNYDFLRAMLPNMRAASALRVEKSERARSMPSGTEYTSLML